MKQLLISCLLLALGLTPSFGGVVLEFESKNHGSRPAIVETSVIGVDGPLLKMEMKTSAAQERHDLSLQSQADDRD